MNRTVFSISKMDCPSEESLIRMKLEGNPNVKNLQFDIPNRKLEVIHTKTHEGILSELETLKLNTSLVSTNTTDEIIDEHPQKEYALLWQVLAINFFFFVLELLTGLIGNSMGLVADGLDMLADSIVYGMSLFAVGATILLKKKIALASGYFQLILSIIGLIEVIRRFLGYEHLPAFGLMLAISFFALIGNALSLFLLQKSKSKEVHMKASLIFTSNDVIVNIGVIIAGVLVYYTNSKLPDLIVGTVVFLIVARGAFRILQLAK